MSAADPLSPVSCEVWPQWIGLVCPAHPTDALLVWDLVNTPHSSLCSSNRSWSIFALWRGALSCWKVIMAYLHQSGLTLWPLTGEVNNTDYLFIVTPVSGWDIIGSEWTCCPPSWCVRSRRVWASLIRAKLWWLDDRVRASSKLQLLWGVPSLQWSVSIKSGPRKEQWWTGNRIMGRQGRTRGGKAGMCGLIQWMSYCCSNWWRRWCKYASGIVWGAQQQVWVVELASESSRSQYNKASVGCAGQTSPIHGGPTSQLTGLKGSPANILVLDTTAHLQGSSGVHASTGQGCFGSKIWTNIILRWW